MRGLGAVVAAVLAVGVMACGGHDSATPAERIVTSEFLATQGEAGYREAVTPGSGGFIETPQARAPKHGRDRDLPEPGEDEPLIEQDPASGESVFTGVHRDVYLRARAACHDVSRRRLARRAGVDSTDPFEIAGAHASGRWPAVWWQPGFEGCAVGITSR